MNGPRILILPFLFLVIAAITSCTHSSQKDTAAGSYQLVWEDNFEQANLDTTSWTFQLGTGAQFGLTGWGNNELQYYTDRPENVYLEDGNLIIEAKKEDFKEMEYTSGKLVTQNKQDFKYGRFEVRAKLPETQGIWPAIWMMPTNNEYGTWPSSGEIDLMELLGHQPDTVYGTIHYGDSFETRGSYTGKRWLTGDSYANDFHIYIVEWMPDTLRWYLDDEHYHTATPSDIAPDNWPFDKEFYFLLNVAVGGNWPGNPDESTVLPQKMVVDYVKVYQKKEQ